MATATKPKQFDHQETQRRVRHPLQQIRATIRRYIFMEGLALTLLAAAILFWAGLAFDFGLFNIELDLIGAYGFDWILSLNDLDTSGLSSLAIRVVLLLLVIVVLLAVGFYKVGLRWFREFNDRAVALVLERRFGKELGDRLITAIELADPKLAKKYGYSQAMVEKTISDCVKILNKLPVSSVFNWRRLYTLWFLVGLSTLGMLLLTMIAISGGSYFTSNPVDPYVYSWRFFDTASIWTERNVLMMNSYWPRRAYLEVRGFQPSALDPNDMHVPLAAEERPNLSVTAYEWVIADKDRTKAPYGWRPLTWKDVSERNLVDADLLARVQIPRDFDAWQLDPEELEPNFATAVFGNNLHIRTSSEVAAYLAELRELGKVNDPNLEWEKRRAIKAVTDPKGAATLATWMDWTEWTMDKLAGQKEVADGPDNARLKLRFQVNGQDQYDALNAVFTQLAERASNPSMARTLRQLEKPSIAFGIFSSPEGGSVIPLEANGTQYKPLALRELKDSSAYRFRIRGDNYFTPSKTITLVAAPTPTLISIDKKEPAYIYHRLNQADQSPLKGVKHETLGMALPISGDTTTIEVPLGSDLTIHVEIDATNLDWGGLHFMKLPLAQAARILQPENEGLLITGVDAGFATDKFPNGRITTTEVKSAGNVTVNTSVGDLKEGDRVTVLGNSLAVANGTWKITEVTGNSFTFANPAATEMNASGKAGNWMSGGITVDDVLIAINDQKVPNDLEAFAKMISKLDTKAPVTFSVIRPAGKTFFGERTEGVMMPATARYQPRRLRPERATDFAKQQIIDPAFAPYQGAPPVIDADRRGFSLAMTNILRKHDFTVEFFDEDNIRGKRRFKILSVLD
ncbi:MAG TPA: hypothetical protein VFE62_30030, partial [Gemmataceae bacterium]|nr:hypothetical protein [Gemmataceae bacterium]